MFIPVYPPNDTVSVGSIHMHQEISKPRTSINVKKGHIERYGCQFTTQVLRILNDFQFIQCRIDFPVVVALRLRKEGGPKGKRQSEGKL